MDPNWIIAICAVLTLVVGTLFSIYKFVHKVRADKVEQEKLAKAAAHAQAEKALEVAREETRVERQKYEESLLARIEKLEKDLSNEEQAREAIQMKYEELLGKKGNPS